MVCWFWMNPISRIKLALKMWNKCKSNRASRIKWHFSMLKKITEVKRCCNIVSLLLNTDQTQVLPVALFNMAAQNDYRITQAKPWWRIKRLEQFSLYQLPPALLCHGAFAIRRGKKVWNIFTLTLLSFLCRIARCHGIIV